MTSYYHPAPYHATLGRINVKQHEASDGRVFALIDLAAGEPGHPRAGQLWIDDPEAARQLLAAAAGACRIMPPSAQQVREVLAQLVLLIADLEEKETRDPEDDGDTLNDQTAPYWPALGLGGAR